MPDKNAGIYNISCGGQTTLNELAKFIQDEVALYVKNLKSEILYQDFRKGDIKHSIADISMASKFLGYDPEYDFESGMKETIHSLCET